MSAIIFGTPYKIPEERKAIALDAKTLEKYVGQYQPPQGSIITVTLENGKLMRQVGVQPQVELFAESETEFFLKGNDLQIKFVTDAQGRITGQLLRRARARNTCTEDQVKQKSSQQIKFMKTLIKNGRIVTAVDDYRADILIEDEMIGDRL